MKSKSDRALIIIDMTPDKVSEVPHARDLIRYIRGELRYFRERGRPVIFACGERGDGKPGVIPELTPRTGETVVFRHTPSVFFGTKLDEILPPEVRRLTLTGIETHTSILLSAGDAFARGFQVVVPEPCVCAKDPADHAFAMRLIRDVWRPWGPGTTPDLPCSEEGRAISDEDEATR